MIGMINQRQKGEKVKRQKGNDKKSCKSDIRRGKKEIMVRDKCGLTIPRAVWQFAARICRGKFARKDVRVEVIARRLSTQSKGDAAICYIVN